MIQKETHFAEGIIESVLTLERAFLVKSENEIKKLVLTENSNISFHHISAKWLNLFFPIYIQHHP